MVCISDCSWLTPNLPNQKISDEIVLKRFAKLTLECKQIPTQADLTLKKKEDPSFPAKNVFRRWGDRNSLLAKVADYCEYKKRYLPVLDLFNHDISSNLNQRLESFRVKEFVYLLRSGKQYKIGRTNAVGRRYVN